MEDLIKALTIFMKYVQKDEYAYSYPTSCDHDELRVYVPPSRISDIDLKELGELGFSPDYNWNCFVSYKYGSC
jgi:hypothetical protein